MFLKNNSDLLGRRCSALPKAIQIILPCLLFALTYCYVKNILDTRAWSVLRAGLQFAEDVGAGKTIAPHFGVPLLTILFHDISGISWERSYAILLALHVVFTFWAIYYVLLNASNLISSTEIYPAIDPVWLCLLACGLMIFGPVGIPGISERVYNFAPDNRSIMLLRNPTHTAVQPYIILSFYYFCLFIKKHSVQSKLLDYIPFAAAGFLFLSALMKPGFAVCFLPALGIFLLLTKQLISRLSLILALLSLPTVGLLIWQFKIGFIYNPIGKYGHLAIDPLAVWRQNNIIPWLSFILATAFPLVVLSARRHFLSFFTILGWINLLIAALLYGLFIEIGHGDRNFEWGYQNGLQIIFLCAVIEWLRWMKETSLQPSFSTVNFRSIDLASILLTVHIIFGYMRVIRDINPLL